MFFFFNDTATTEIYTLSLHDALPIYFQRIFTDLQKYWIAYADVDGFRLDAGKHVTEDFLAYFSTQIRDYAWRLRSEEHTSELQSRQYLVCRLLLEKKTKNECTKCSNT